VVDVTVNTTAEFDAGSKSPSGGNNQIETLTDSGKVAADRIQLASKLGDKFTVADADGDTWKWNDDDVSLWPNAGSTDVDINTSAVGKFYFDSVNSGTRGFESRNQPQLFGGAFDIRVNIKRVTGAGAGSFTHAYIMAIESGGGDYMMMDMVEASPRVLRAQTSISAAPLTDDVATDDTDVSMRIVRDQSGNMTCWYDLAGGDSWTEIIGARRSGFISECRIVLGIVGGASGSDEIEIEFGDLEITEGYPVVLDEYAESNNASTVLGDVGGVDYWMGQSFQCSGDILLQAASIMFTANVGTPPNIRIDLYDESGGEPNNIIASSLEHAPGDVLPGGHLLFRFATPITLSGSTIYFIMGKCVSTPSTDNRYAPRYDTTGTYANGNWFYSTDAGSTWNTLARDLAFRIWASTPSFETSVPWASEVHVMTPGQNMGTCKIYHSGLDGDYYIDKIEWYIGEILKATYATPIEAGSSTEITVPTSGSFGDIDDDYFTVVYMEGSGFSTPVVTKIEETFAGTPSGGPGAPAIAGGGIGVNV